MTTTFDPIHTTGRAQLQRGTMRSFAPDDELDLPRAWLAAAHAGALFAVCAVLLVALALGGLYLFGALFATG